MLIFAPAHYCHFDEAGEVVDGKMSLIGEYLPPVANFDAEAWRLMRALWRGDSVEIDHLRKAAPWLAYPAVKALSYSRPAIAPMVSDVAKRPFDRFLAAQVIGQKRGEETIRSVAVAPYDPRPERWADLPWYHAASGEQIDLDKPDAESRTWLLVTVEDLLRLNTHVHPHAALDYRGRPCTGRTRGPLSRLSMRDGRKYVTGKDRIGWRQPDDPIAAFTAVEAPAPAWPLKPDREFAWPMVHEAAKVIGAAPLAKKMEKTARSVRRWLDGSVEPPDPPKIMAAVADCLFDIDETIGMALAIGEAADAGSVCAALPARAATLECFVAGVIDFLARSGRPLREIARAAGVPESTLREWRGGPAIFAPDREGISEIGKTVDMLHRFGVMARAAGGEGSRHRQKPGKRLFMKHALGDLEAIFVALSRAAGVRNPEPPLPRELPQRVEWFVTGMICMWFAEAAAEQHPLIAALVAAMSIVGIASAIPGTMPQRAAA